MKTQTDFFRDLPGIDVLLPAEPAAANVVTSTPVRVR